MGPRQFLSREEVLQLLGNGMALLDLRMQQRETAGEQEDRVSLCSSLALLLVGTSAAAVLGQDITHASH
jgi:hypothetical protein